MASLITVRIDKGQSPNLGFRLQGGKDFGTPLVIQKVNGGSPAERAGLIAGDSVIKINNIDVFNLRHKDAQDVVVRAGPSFEISIQRGGSTWKPTVIPTGPLHSPTANFNNVSPVTRTSLASHRTENIGSIGTGHNLAAKPFNPQVNGAVNGGSKLINKQYNTPLKLYSEESIAETLSAQTEVLSTGALGVNFKKNERNYDSSNSEVLRALKEAENEPNYTDQVIRSDYYSTQSHAIGGQKSTTPNPNVPEHFRSVAVGTTEKGEAPKTLPEGATICSDCERVIVGVFVRIKEKNLHVECFKCSTCGTSLKNVGYYNIDNKLYCDIHAKSAALKIQSNPNLVPVTVPPGGKAPAHAISSALSSHSYPTSSPLSPKLSPAGTQYQTSNFSGPKPFSSVGAPLSPHNTLPKAAPLSPVAPAPVSSFNHSYSPSAYSPSSVKVTENIIWPPPQDESDVPTACPLFYPPPSHIEQNILKKRKEKKEKESEEEDCPEIEKINEMAHFLPSATFGFSSERRSTEEVKESLTETLDTQILVENIVKTRAPASVPPIEKDILPSEYYISAKKPCPISLPDDICYKKQNECDNSSVREENLSLSNDLPVPLKWESPLTQAIRTTSPDKDTFSCIPTKHSSTAFATALSVAPLEPFTPTTNNEEMVPLPEETEPYFPPERPVLPERESDSTLPPIRKKFGPVDKLLEDLPKPEGKLSMLTALTTAPDRPYSPFAEITSNEKDAKINIDTKLSKTVLQKPDILPSSFKVNKKQPNPPVYYPPSVLYEKTEEAKSVEHLEESSSTQTTTMQRQTMTNFESETLNKNQNELQMAPLFHGFSCSFQNKGDISQFSVDVRTTPPIMSTPPPNAIFKTIEKPGYTEVETTTEAKTHKQQKSKKEEAKNVVQMQEKVVLKPSVKQDEEVIPIKAVPQVTLHKPTQLPHYQIELSAEAESELIFLEKKRQAEIQIEELKKKEKSLSLSQSIKYSTPRVQPPAIKVEEETSDRNFKPVVEECPSSHSFSPRQGSSTPSISGSKPTSILPYYQTNLVPQYMSATHSNVFDPKSPGLSRSPSPCPPISKDRSTSPLPKSNIRATSPAPGPPENPLKSSKPLPSPETTKIEQARENITGYLPEYKIQRDYIEETKGIHINKETLNEIPQMYTSTVQTQMLSPNQPKQQTNTLQRSDLLEAQRSEKSVSQQENSCLSYSKEEQLRQAHLEQFKRSQKQSIERSADGSTQIQKKTMVTEEYERSQKEVNIQIEKNVTTTKKYPFSEVNAPALEIPNIKGHITDPQRISSNFLKSDCAKIEDCLKQRTQSLPLRAADQPTQSSAQLQLLHAATASTKHGLATSSIKPVSSPETSTQPNVSSVSSQPNAGTTGGRQAAGVKVAPRRGRGILNPAAIGGARIPLCGNCNMQVRGPFITALGKIWCPNHFICATQSCRRPLQDIGFVEERGQLYCEYCFEQYLAPPCSKCAGKIKGDCLKAIGKNFHPECFNCTYCGKLFGNSPFFLEDGSPYCETDWNELFTTKCYACAFPIEAGDRWVEALSNNYHSQCFNCTMCKKNLEGQSFFAKGGRPFCKNHAR